MGLSMADYGVSRKNNCTPNKRCYVMSGLTALRYCSCIIKPKTSVINATRYVYHRWLKHVYLTQTCHYFYTLYIANKESQLLHSIVMLLCLCPSCHTYLKSGLSPVSIRELNGILSLPNAHPFHLKDLLINKSGMFYVKTVICLCASTC